MHLVLVLVLELALGLGLVLAPKAAPRQVHPQALVRLQVVRSRVVLQRTVHSTLCTAVVVCLCRHHSQRFCAPPYLARAPLYQRSRTRTQRASPT